MWGGKKYNKQGGLRYMEESRLDILAPREQQLKILVPYLEKAASEGDESELPITTRSKVLVDRYLWSWIGLYNKNGLTVKGALKYYRRLNEDRNNSSHKAP